MTKQKKIVLSVIAVFSALLIGIAVFFGVRYAENKISFTVRDTLPDGEGREVTVIFLGGQSNASGCSSDEYLKKNVSAEKYAEYEGGYDNVYINYYASGANESQAFVPCAVRQGEAGGYFGPELGLAEKLHEEHPDELFFIIKYAWGGTNLFEQWLSPSSDGKTGELYRAFVAYAKESIEYLKDKNYKVSVKGMCWMQGESDSFSMENATDYGEHLSNFISDVRKEFSRYAKGNGIAFVDAYIADNPIFWVYCDIVNEKKKEVADSSPMNVVVDTVAHGLSCAAEPEGSPDLAHYDSESQIKLGHLFAEALDPFIR